MEENVANRRTDDARGNRVLHRTSSFRLVEERKMLRMLRQDPQNYAKGHRSSQRRSARSPGGRQPKIAWMSNETGEGAPVRCNAGPEELSTGGERQTNAEKKNVTGAQGNRRMFDRSFNRALPLPPHRLSARRHCLSFPAHCRRCRWRRHRLKKLQRSRASKQRRPPRRDWRGQQVGQQQGARKEAKALQGQQQRGRARLHPSLRQQLLLLPHLLAHLPPSLPPDVLRGSFALLP
jgi:hypothetical protein